MLRFRGEAGGFMGRGERAGEVGGKGMSIGHRGGRRVGWVEVIECMDF